MPNRVIREEVSTSRSLAGVSLFAEGFWFKLLTAIDDHGRLDSRATVLKGRLYPLRPEVTPRRIEGWLQELASVDTIRFYEVDGMRYALVPAWTKHNRLRARTSRYPNPPRNAAGITRQRPLSDVVTRQQQPADVGPTRASADLDLDMELDPHTPRVRGEGECEGRGADAPRATNGAMSPEELVQAWNANRGGMAGAVGITNQRKRRILGFLRSRPALKPDEFGAVVSALGRDDWACGRTSRRKAPVALEFLIEGDSFERQREKLASEPRRSPGEAGIGHGEDGPLTNATQKLRELHASGLPQNEVSRRYQEWKYKVGEAYAFAPVQPEEGQGASS